MNVFIDGENLRHRLVDVLYQDHLIEDRDNMFRIDIPRIIEGALGEKPASITYYTTHIKQPQFEIPELLEKKINRIQESHRRWVAMLTNQGIKVIKAGNLRVKESNACYHCGRRTMVLHEKGVDVRLAAEVVVAAVHDDVKDIAVLSSDADMIPALEIAKKGGASITYFCFEEEVNDALSQVCSRTVTYDREHVRKAFKGISAATPASDAPAQDEAQEAPHGEHQ